MTKILQKEAPVLHMQAEPVSQKDIGSPRLGKIITDMKALLTEEEDGVGIAAPQIGIPLRIFVVSHRAFEYADDHDEAPTNIARGAESAQKPAHEDLVFINPEIIKLSRKKKWLPEGCLSVRWLYGETLRAEKATVSAYDEYGKRFTRGGSGLLAQIFQHEVDHLNGILFNDHAKNLEKISPEEQKKMWSVPTAEGREKTK